jgi:hypothetical protein
MKTPSQAMLGELWHTSRWDLLGRTAGQLLLVLLFYALTFTHFTTPESIPVIRGIVLMLLMTISQLSITWLGNVDNRQTGFCFRLGFARPVTTVRLVLVPMLFSMTTAALCFLFPVLLFRLLFQSEMPIVGPAAVIVSCVAVFVMTTWSPTTVFGKFLAILAACLGIAGLAKGFRAMTGDPDPFLLALGKPERFDFAWYHYLGLLALTLLACLVTVLAVDRQRHGEGFRWKRKTRPESPAQKPVENRRPFSSPLAAQFWFELRRVAPKMLLVGILVPLVVLFVITLIRNSEPDWPYAPVAWLFALMASPVLCQFIGIESVAGLRYKQGAVQYSVFEATRALRTDQLVLIKLFVIAACSLVVWLGVAATAGADAVISNEVDTWRRIGAGLKELAGTVRFSWGLAGACSLLLFYLSSSSVLLAFGFWLPLHGRIFIGLAAFGYFHLILAICDQAATRWSLRPLWIVYGWTFALAIVTGCAFMLRKALVSGYLSGRVLGSASVLWIVYVVSIVTLYGKFAEHFPVPAAGLAFGAAMLLVPLATTAIAPLALASHRHR